MASGGTPTASARMEAKLDALADSVGKMETAQVRIADQLVSTQAMTDQLFKFMQQAIDRLASELDEERTDRRKEDSAIRSSLSKVAFAIFSAVVTAIASGAFLLLSQK